MVSTGTINRPDTWGYDPSEGGEVAATGDEVYSGPMRLQRKSTTAMWAPAGAETLPVAGYVGAVPWHATEVCPGDVVTMTASHDPSVIGRRFKIIDVEHNALLQTARRIHAELLNP